MGQIGEELNACDIKPESFTGECIPMVGYRDVKFTFKGRKAEGRMYVAEYGPCVLGWKDQKSLKIILNPNSKEQVLVLNEGDELGKKLCEEYKEVFSGNIGLLKGFKHKIVLRENAVPVNFKVRSVPFVVRNELEKELHRLESAGVIEQIESSQWMSPIVVARKANGKIRLCVDLRGVNKEIQVDKYPLPKINELLSKTKGMKWFSTVDLSNAYHQVPLHEESRKITSFITPFGCYQYVRMPFGLASAAAVFQRLMSEVLRGITGVLFFQDDILIMGENRRKHDERLKGVLDVLKRRGLTAEYGKCHFAKNEITYLGHSIGRDGVSPKRELVEAVREAPEPRNKDELRSFLGLAEYYSKFVRNFAEKSYDLRQLLKQKNEFVWDQKCKENFETLKNEICTATPIKGFDPELRSVLTVGASGKGLGAVLTQFEGGTKEVVIGFASRSLTPTEELYSVIEKETLGCVWGMEYFRAFLWGTEFDVRTDHKPLVTLLTTGGMVKASARLSMRLQDYNYRIKYVPGQQNRVADCLSRIPLPVKEVPKNMWDDYQVATVEEEIICSVAREEWIAEYEKDILLIKIKERILRGWGGRKPDMAEERSYWEVRNKLSVESGFIIRSGKIIPPIGLRKRVIELCHEGHFGIVRTKRRVKCSYWWPGIDMEVERIVRECGECADSDKSLKTMRPKLLPMECPVMVWDLLAVDFVGPVQSGNGESKFIIVLIDYFSKWVELEIVEKADADTVVKFLSNVFLREGLPKRLISDNGTHFTASKVETFLKRNGIQHNKTSVYHPSGNGAVERFNRVIKGTIQIACKNRRNWEAEVKKML